MAINPESHPMGIHPLDVVNVHLVYKVEIHFVENDQVVSQELMILKSEEKNVRQIITYYVFTNECISENTYVSVVFKY